MLLDRSNSFFFLSFLVEDDMEEEESLQDLHEQLAQARRNEEKARRDAQRAAEAKVDQRAKEFLRLQQQLAEAERRAKAATEESTRSKQEQQQQFNSMHGQFQSFQQQLTAKQEELQKFEEQLKQQAQSLYQQKQQQEADANSLHQQADTLRRQQEQQVHAQQPQAKEVKAYAEQVLEEVGRYEKRARKASSAAAAASAAAPADPADPPIVAFHPQTQLPLTEEDVDELVRQYADFKEQKYEEVIEWIKGMKPESSQQVVDLLFAGS